jgi:ribose 5-phosphate isomerase B
MVVTRPKRIALGADHGGIDLKSVLAEHLQKAGHQVEDVGTSSHEAVDYPVFARAVAEAVSQERADVGIMWLVHGRQQDSRGACSARL